jgi:pimeloyl-ACP methyl ester carboxylesterase
LNRALVAVDCFFCKSPSGEQCVANLWRQKAIIFFMTCGTATGDWHLLGVSGSRSSCLSSGAGRKSTPWLHKEAVVNGTRTHWVEAGRQGDPLVVLLHGFPAFWYTWSSTIIVLADAGYRVVAPDLRGVNLSERVGVGFDLHTLSEDCSELLDMLEVEKCILVGHDWGGMIAAATAARFPYRVEKVVLLHSVPMQALELSRLPWSHRIRLRSLVFFSKFTWLARTVFSFHRAWLLSRYIQGTGVDDRTLDVYRDALGRPGSIFCWMQYIRTLPTSLEQANKLGKILSPVLFVSGRHVLTVNTTDEEECSSLWLPSDCYRRLNEWVEGSIETVTLPSCGNWSPHDAPDELNQVLLRFCAKKP